jgi:hypothetical protein
VAAFLPSSVPSSIGAPNRFTTVRGRQYKEAHGTQSRGWALHCAFQHETADKGRIGMKRFVVVAAVVALVSVPGTASAHEGHGSCQAFGEGAAAEAQAQGGLGELARQVAPVNDEVAALHESFCA